jgi:signal transduction histidine kinase
MGDRVQLQQVLMNLMINGMDAMKNVDGTRELTIKSQRAENEQLLVSVCDTGVGLPPQQTDQIFNAFFNQAPRHRHGTSHQPRRDARRLLPPPARPNCPYA